MQIALRNRKKEIVAYAIVDKDDYERLNKINWSLQATGYPQAWDRMQKKTRTMHQMVLNIPAGYKNKNEVDHINHDKLDNRKNNLRFTDRTENSRNQQKAQTNSTTGYLNVGKLRNGYNIRMFGQYYGFYKDLDEAIYNAKIIRKAILNID